MAALERVLLPRVLAINGGHLTRASDILGLSRNHLRQKMRTLGLALDKVLSEEDRG